MLTSVFEQVNINKFEIRESDLEIGYAITCGDELQN